MFTAYGRGGSVEEAGRSGEVAEDGVSPSGLQFSGYLFHGVDEDKEEGVEDGVEELDNLLSTNFRNFCQYLAQVVEQEGDEGFLRLWDTN